MNHNLNGCINYYLKKDISLNKSFQLCIIAYIYYAVEYNDSLYNISCYDYESAIRYMEHKFSINSKVCLMNPNRLSIVIYVFEEYKDISEYNLEKFLRRYMTEMMFPSVECIVNYYD